MVVDPWASTNQGLGNLSNTLASLAQMKRQDQQYADEAPERANRQTLADLQVTAAQQAMNDGQAKQNALIDLYGTAKHTDPLASAYSFQGQEQQDAEQQKAAKEKQKYAFDEFTKVAKAVDDGVIEPKAATDYYHNAMKLSGIDLQAAGVNLEFQKAKGGYFSGPVAPDSIFMMGGKPTPYGAQGIVSKARIVGQDPQSGKPIFEMDENTTFAEAKKDDGPETWGKPYETNVGGKRAMMQESNRGQVRSVLSDNSTTTTVKVGGDEKDYRKQSYQMQKEIRGDKYINQADDSNQKLSAMENAYAEGKRTGNYTGADQAIGYYVNKLFDPDSVVMVSEFQRVAQSQGVPDKMVGSLQALATGGIKLTDESRDALIRTVKEINKTVQGRKSDRLQQYRNDAIAMGLDPDKVLAGRDKQKPAGGKGGGANSGAQFIASQYQAYGKAGLKEDEIQKRIYSKLKSQKWSDKQIAEAWRAHKGQ